MRRPGLVVVGAVIALAGAVFCLQGFGVIHGSAMTNSTFWASAGPVIFLVGLVAAVFGVRGRLR
jgi:hypothetical protein